MARPFYVSISRAKERARIYTDDAELLRRRVEDSHTRKAAVELEGLREALRLAGYRRREEEERTARAQRTERDRAAEQQTQTERVTPRATVERTIRRVVRQLRELRAERLAPVQRVAQSFRQWLGERVGVTQREQQTIRPDPPRQSRGIRM